MIGRASLTLEDSTSPRGRMFLFGLIVLILVGCSAIAPVARFANAGKAPVELDGRERILDECDLRETCRLEGDVERGGDVALLLLLDDDDERLQGPDFCEEDTRCAIRRDVKARDDGESIIRFCIN